MIQGIYLAAQGMTSLMQKQDQIANNLANINTTAYKQSGLFVRTYQKYVANINPTKQKHSGPFVEPSFSYPAGYPLEPRVDREIKADQVYIDYSEGRMKKTGAALDLMIKGSGFFKVMTPEGVRYTRNGNFSLSPDGFLVTADGSKVMSKKGFVRIDDDPQGNVAGTGDLVLAETLLITITERGEVIQDGIIRDMLRIVDFKKPYRLLRDGSGYFKPQLPDNPETESQGYVVKQGFLEASNVNIVKNMVRMISAFRNFEANQKALMAQDETLEKAVNQVGRVG